jgi:asparagine synthase (glutamine-hydrolysing)
MCGIFGLFRDDPAGLDLDEVQQATSVLSSRGPDDACYLLADLNAGSVTLCGDADTDERSNLPHIQTFRGRPFRLALGFRRLSILDPSPFGRQPMGTPDGRQWVVFNGQIYNFIELKQTFAAAGREFASGSDTEVLLAAYQQLGTDAFPRFVGMFALALLDLGQSTVTLARDFFGIKPLYYVRWRGGFAFASDMRALLRLRGVGRKVNPPAVSDYLRYGLTNHNEETLFDNIYQVPLGSYMVLRLGSDAAPAPERYWQPRLEPPLEITFTEAADKLREMFLRSVELHMRSDVPVGAGLSGGVDSSAIVMAMRLLKGKKLDLNTFSYVASNPSQSEERWIKIIEEQCRPNGRRIKVEPGELADGLDDLIDAQCEPFGSASVFAQYKLYQVVRANGVKVMLDGQGADELLAGYRSLLGARLASLLKAGQWTAAARFLSAALSSLPGTSARQILTRTWDLLAPHLRQPTDGRIPRGHLPLAGMNRRWFYENGQGLAASITGRSSRDILREQLLNQLAVDDLPLLLRIEDRNAMASSVENRVPFLTPELAHFTLSLPESFLLAEDATTKAIFRHAMCGIVPPQVLNRRDKIGFATLDPAWLRALLPWVSRVLRSEITTHIPALEPAALRREWDTIAARGEQISAVDCRRFDTRIWRWIALIRWAEHFDVSFAA